MFWQQQQQQQYDENLQTNPFFIRIQTHHSDILQRASQESWIVAIPRLGTFTEENITDAVIMDHILIPASEAPALFYTLSKKQLRVENKQLFGVMQEHETYSQPVRILFEETFYTNSFKCCFLCLEAPLFTAAAPAPSLPSHHLVTLHDCLNFLWSENLGAHLGHIHDLCAQFSSEKHASTVETEKRVYNLYTNCLDTVKEKKCCDNLRLAVETYMQNCLDSHLVKLINTLTCSEDANLNKILRNACNNLHLKDLSSENDDGIIEAKHELAKLNKFNTVLDKINCLRTTLNCLRPKQTLTSDHILQVFVFLIAKIPINNWISNLTYITRFRFSVAASITDDTTFITTSFEAALEFIKSNKFTFRPQEEDLAVFRVISNGGSLSELSREKCHPLCVCELCSTTAPICNVEMRNERGQSLLIAASIHGRLDFVEFLLNNSAAPDLQDFSGRTALHYAAAKGHQDILMVLVADRGSDVNQKDNEGNTALHYSTLHGHENCVKALLYSTGRYLDINAVNNKSESALHLATKWSYIEIMQILLENHIKATLRTANTKETAFDLANNYSSLQVLRDYSFQFDFVQNIPEKKRKSGRRSRNSVDSQLEHGQRPRTVEQIKKIDLLLKAIENNDLPLSCFYLGYSTPNDYIFQSKCHPLCNCDKCSVDESQADLLPDTINVNMCNLEGFTALHVAAKWGRTEILKILLDSQAEPCLKTYHTLQTALHLASINQHVSVVKELVATAKSGSSIDARDYKGNTALYYASIGNCAKVVEVLLANGASCEVKNFKGNTVIQEIQDKCLFGMARLLCQERVISTSDAEEYDFL